MAQMSLVTIRPPATLGIVILRLYVITVSLPDVLPGGKSGNPSDPEVIESACYSRLAEPYMIEKYQADEDFWAQYNIQPSWTYFGAHFRKLLATHQEHCGSYDHRERPWFVAALSGPKDVVLVLDSSGSMDKFCRTFTAKQAAITVINTLTVADRVAVVSFASGASLVGGYSNLIRATSENKKELAIESLKAVGGTNFYARFNAAFNALDKTIRNESTSGCNIAVLFMTDGGITEGSGADSVINLVNQRTQQLATNFNRKTTVFTSSLGSKADHDVMKSIACNTNGIWTPVDNTKDLVSTMSSYYKLYMLWALVNLEMRTSLLVGRAL
ncbi:LOW QUALITY PROTEIN: hypothetical protein ACHAXR_003728 [Thalassiosira sp. AJA248-18]